MTADGTHEKRRRRGTRQWLAGPERRRQLLDAAIHTAAQRGLGRVGHAEIAKLARVAVSSVFLYFPNRRDLLEAIVGEVARFYIELATTHHEAASDPRDAVLSHFHAFVDSVSTHPDHAQVWLEWAVLIRNDEGLWDRFLEFQEHIIRIVAGSVRRAQACGRVAKSLTAADAARLIVAAAYTATQLKFMHRSERTVRRYSAHALELALGSPGQG